MSDFVSVCGIVIGYKKTDYGHIFKAKTAKSEKIWSSPVCKTRKEALYAILCELQGILPAVSINYAEKNLLKGGQYDTNTKKSSKNGSNN